MWLGPNAESWHVEPPPVIVVVTITRRRRQALRTAKRARARAHRRINEFAAARPVRSRPNSRLRGPWSPSHVRVKQPHAKISLNDIWAVTVHSQQKENVLLTAGGAAQVMDGGTVEALTMVAASKWHRDRLAAEHAARGMPPEVISLSLSRWFWLVRDNESLGLDAC